MTGLALLAALAACAEQPRQVGFQGAPQLPAPVSNDMAPPGTGGVKPAWPAPPASATALPPAQIDASTLPEGYPRLVWTEGDGRTVGAYGQEGGCTIVHPELRAQAPQLIRIAFMEVTTSAGPCTMDLRHRPLTVQLDDPLGARTVVLERQTSGP